MFMQFYSHLNADTGLGLIGNLYANIACQVLTKY